jgi:hypothetical protein
MRRGVAVARAIFPCADVCRGSCQGGSAAIVAVELPVPTPRRQTSFAAPRIVALPPPLQRGHGQYLHGLPVPSWKAGVSNTSPSGHGRRLPASRRWRYERAFVASDDSNVAVTTDLQGVNLGERAVPRSLRYGGTHFGRIDARPSPPSGPCPHNGCQSTPPYVELATTDMYPSASKMCVHPRRSLARTGHGYRANTVHVRESRLQDALVCKRLRSTVPQAGTPARLPTRLADAGDDG